MAATTAHSPWARQAKLSSTSWPVRRGSDGNRSCPDRALCGTAGLLTHNLLRSVTADHLTPRGGSLAGGGWAHRSSSDAASVASEAAFEFCASVALSHPVAGHVLLTGASSFAQSAVQARICPGVGSATVISTRASITPVPRLGVPAFPSVRLSSLGERARCHHSPLL